MKLKYEFDLEVFNSIPRPIDNEWVEENEELNSDDLTKLKSAGNDPFAILNIIGSWKLSCHGKAYVISLLWKRAMGEIENTLDFKDEIPACHEIVMLLYPDYSKLYWTGEDQQAALLKQAFSEQQIIQLSLLFEVGSPKNKDSSEWAEKLFSWKCFQSTCGQNTFQF